MKRAPSASRESYTSLEPNLLGLHPEDEERESHCVVGHGVMLQQSLHLAPPTCGALGRERLWLCITDEKPHPEHFYPGYCSDILPECQQMETLVASPDADCAR